MTRPTGAINIVKNHNVGFSRDESVVIIEYIEGIEAELAKQSLVSEFYLEGIELSQVEITNFTAELAKQEWVSVEDRPPEEGQDVIIMTNYYMVTSAKYRETEYVRILSCRRCDGLTIGSVTYWKPIILPEKKGSK